MGWGFISHYRHRRDRAKIHRWSCHENEQITPRLPIAEKLEGRYTQFDYQWGSRATEARAFQEITQYDRRDISSIVRVYTHPQTGKYIGLLMEPFVKNLLTKTGVVGRMRNLHLYDVKPRKIKFGPWLSKIYRSHSEIVISKGVCNIPHWGVETQISAIIPSEGLIFAIGKYKDRGIKRTEIDDLFKANVFGEFLRTRPQKVVRMIWMVECQEYKNFRKQRSQDYGEEETDEFTPNEIEQWAFEVDLLRISEFEKARRHRTVINMTAKRRWKEISGKVEYQWECVNDSIMWAFYRFRGVIGL